MARRPGQTSEAVSPWYAQKLVRPTKPALFRGRWPRAIHKKAACDSVSAAQVSVKFRHVNPRAEQAGPFFRWLPETRALGICLCRSRWYALPRAPRRPLQSYNTFALRLISEV